MQNVSAPDEVYRAFWLAWSIQAWLATALLAVVVLALAGVAARLWLVNPLIRSNQESAGRIVRAVELQGERAACK